MDVLLYQPRTTVEFEPELGGLVSITQVYGDSGEASHIVIDPANFERLFDAMRKVAREGAAAEAV